MSRVIHFEIPADNPERATAFYAKALGWEFDKFPGPMSYWLVRTGADDRPGINGGLLQRMGQEQTPMVVAGVESVDASSAQIARAGGVNVVPKMAIPGVGWCAYFKDTEGNIFGIYEDDASAK